jgi:hypothetical protein
MSGGSHEWNVIIFMPQDENISCIYRKKLELSVYYIHLSLILNYNLEDNSLNFVYWQNLEKESPARHQWKHGKCFTEIIFLQWKAENENKRLISSIFLNISFIGI